MPFLVRVKGAPPRPQSSYISGAHRQPSRSNTRAPGNGLEVMLTVEIVESDFPAMLGAAAAMKSLHKRS